MMTLFNTTGLGIDFRRSHLVLTLLEKSFKKIRLVDYGIYPLFSEGQKELQEAQWTSFITSFISKHQINQDKISIAIPREKMMLRFLRVPVATKENLRKVLEYEAPKYTPFDKEELFLDYQILREDAEGISLVVVYVKKSDINPYLSLLQKMGLQPLSVQLPAAAALNLFFLHGGEKSSEISVLLDMSNPFCEMNVLQGKEWKESFHLSLPSEGRDKAVLNSFKRSSGLNGDALSKATFFIYGLDAAEEALPVFGEIDPWKGVSSPPLDLIEVAKEEMNPYYIYSSIGLPLLGLVKTRLTLNLLPPEMRKKVREISRYLLFTLLTLVILLSFTWGWGILRNYSRELDFLRAEVAKRKPEAEAVEKLRKEGEDLRKEVGEFEKITATEVSKVEILKELTQILPNTVWIWNFKYTGREAEISGFADSASDLLTLIDKSPLFEKVEFSAPVTKERERRIGSEKEKERFKIKMRLEGQRVISG